MIAEAEWTVSRAYKSVAVCHRTTSFRSQVLQVQLTMRLPIISNYPGEAVVTVMNICFKMIRAICGLLSNTRQNVLMTQTFG